MIHLGCDDRETAGRVPAIDAGEGTLRPPVSSRQERVDPASTCAFLILNFAQKVVDPPQAATSVRLATVRVRRTPPVDRRYRPA